MGRTIGFDLGTTSSVLAFVDQGTPRIIRNADGSRLTPSVVGVDARNELVVGAKAIVRARRFPRDAASSVKRLMGRRFADPDVQAVVRRVLYEVRGADDGDCEIVLGDRAYSPTELSAAIMRELKREAEDALGDTVTHAVITVPPHFGQRQREATQQAGALAGFDGVRLLDDSVAVALAYGHETGIGDPRRILVYYLGGSSFAVSVILVSADAIVEVANSGDRDLGGERFTLQILDHVLETIQRQSGVDLLTSAKALQLMSAAAEDAKITLSQHDHAAVYLPSIPYGDSDQTVDVEVEISRDEYEAMIRPLVDETRQHVHKAISDAGCTAADIDQIVLVGGSSLTPLVRRTLEAEFGSEKILQHIDPREVVALGAAIQSAIDTREEAHVDTNRPTGVTAERDNLNSYDQRDRQNRLGGGSFDVVMSATLPLGFRAGDDAMIEVFPAGTGYPTLCQRQFVTATPNQRVLRLSMYEGEHAIASHNTYLGDVVAELPDGLPTGTEVTISFELDQDGILAVSAHVPAASSVRIAARLDSGSSPSSPDEPSYSRTDVSRARSPEVPGGRVDRVRFSVTTPKAVIPGSSFVVDVWAHLAERRPRVLREAREALGGEKPRIRTKGPVLIARGTSLTVHLRVRGLLVDDPEDVIFWEGEIGNATFAVRVPSEAAHSEYAGQASIYVDSLRIARMDFGVTVGSHMAPEPVTVEAPRHRKAFASYASEDVDEVIGRLQGIQKAAPDLEFFFDRASLHSGQRWEQELYTRIPTSDVFYLFWSAHARASEWVEREWRCALSTRGLDFIDPVPLVPPDIVPPPTELASKHFNDWMLAFRRRAPG